MPVFHISVTTAINNFCILFPVIFDSNIFQALENPPVFFVAPLKRYMFKREVKLCLK